MNEVAIGIDLGGSSIKGGILTPRGEVLETFSKPTPPNRGVHEVVEAICSLVNETTGDSSKWGEVAGLGIGSPGAMDLTKGVIHISPNFPEWNEVPLRDMVQAGVSIPCVLENDANSAAQGEYWVGAGKGASSLALLTLGTGIGGGLVLEGRPWHGHNDVGAELGHMTLNCDGPVCGCGNKGCLEAYASATAMVRRLKEAVAAGGQTVLASKLDVLTARDIYQAAVAGDELAMENMEKTGFYIGCGITSIMHALNPEMILLSGGMTAAGDMLMAPIIKTIEERAIKASREKTKVRFAALAEAAGFIGAAGCLFRELGISA